MLGLSWPLKGILRRLNISLPTKVNLRGGESHLVAAQGRPTKGEETELTERALLGCVLGLNWGPLGVLLGLSWGLLAPLEAILSVLTFL